MESVKANKNRLVWFILELFRMKLLLPLFF
jgi:hypothetical protein